MGTFPAHGSLFSKCCTHLEWQKKSAFPTVEIAAYKIDGFSQQGLGLRFAPPA